MTHQIFWVTHYFSYIFFLQKFLLFQTLLYFESCVCAHILISVASWWNDGREFTVLLREKKPTTIEVIKFLQYLWAFNYTFKKARLWNLLISKNAFILHSVQFFEIQPCSLKFGVLDSQQILKIFHMRHHL